MSRDDILNMPVGRELDALVAEKVMGLDVVGPNRDKINSFPGWVWMVNYSTDISAAWEALNKFTPHQITQSKTGFSHSDLQYRAIIGKNHNSAYGDTAPEAICKAALLAVME